MKAAIPFALALAFTLNAQVKIDAGESKYTVTVNGKPFTDFYFGSDTQKPYLHPLRAASGTIVTRGYPMLENVPGESKDHPHHRGLWFTHGDVNGFDFWANEPSQKSEKKGRIVLKQIGAKSKNDEGRIDSQFEWRGPDGKPLLIESRVMTFYAHPTLRIVDFDSTLKALDQKVVFGDTKEGTFAIRLAAALEEPTRRSLADPPRTGKMVSAEGAEGESKIWGKRSPWVDYYGKIGEEVVGVAIFDHPKNPKHPTYWHSRSYGLFAANIFGEHDFYADKTRNGSVTVEPGKALRFRYRVVIHPGDTKTADVAKLYRDYIGHD
jgi:hypothetical protein